VKWPEAVADATVVAIVVEVAALTTAWLTFKLSSSFAGVELKLVPTMFTAVPAIPLLGLKLVMVGKPLLEVTVKFWVLVAEPFGLITEIRPVVAVDGTDT
jgi:hypothetical protein